VSRSRPHPSDPVDETREQVSGGPGGGQGEAAFRPAAPYVEGVLQPNFDFQRRQFFPFLLEILAAHAAMLQAAGLLTREETSYCLRLLGQVNRKRLQEASYDSRFEDFFLFLQHELEQAGDPSIVGKMFLARSRNDVGATLYRMALREELLALVSAVLDGRRTLLLLSRSHRETMIPAYTHTQPAQPTTLAHYLLAAAAFSGRDVERLRNAFAFLNRSPLGACALTTTGFPIDRDLTAHWLGFEGLVENSYDAIASADYLTGALMAVAVAVNNLGRFVQDLLLWCTEEYGLLRLADGFVQASTIMPQKRNPVALEHARALASRALGRAQAVLVMLHNTPFGDINDAEDDVQPLALEALRDARVAWSLVGAALASAEINTKRLRELAASGLMTVTELTDVLVRRDGLAFAEAHRLVAEAVRHCGEQRTPERVVSALQQLAEARLGRPLRTPEAELTAALTPEEFVRVRRVRGGPAPEEVTRQIESAEEQLLEQQAWLKQKQQLLARTHAQLQRLVESADPTCMPRLSYGPLE
jgi:argininosuccinate lyase